VVLTSDCPRVSVVLDKVLFPLETGGSSVRQRPVRIFHDLGTVDGYGHCCFTVVQTFEDGIGSFIVERLISHFINPHAHRFQWLWSNGLPSGNDSLALIRRADEFQDCKPAKAGVSFNDVTEVVFMGEFPLLVRRPVSGHGRVPEAVVSIREITSPGCGQQIEFRGEWFGVPVLAGRI
jgi:hypothetical protein